MNRGPSRRCVPPVIAPAEGIVRAGDVLRGGGVLLRGDACLVPGVRFSRNVLRSITPVFAVSSRCLMFAHACCLPPVRQTGRLAGCCVSIPPWVVIANSAFSWCRCGYLPWRVHFGFVRFFMAIPTGYRDAGTELRGGRGWRRGACASLRNRIGLVMLSAGSTLGLRAPNLRQRVFDSLDSLHAAAGLP